MKIIDNYRATATALQQQNQECFPTTNTPAHLQLCSQNLNIADIQHTVGLRPVAEPVSSMQPM